MKNIANYSNFALAMEQVEKAVTIQINLKDLEVLKQSGYHLCFAKKVGDSDYNVVWQSSTQYLETNTFSWIPKYELFGTNTFRSSIQVVATTNIQAMLLGQTALLNSSGVLEPPYTEGPDTSITMANDFGPIHPGVNQLVTGIDGTTTSAPIYVAQQPIVSGIANLTPVEKILVWFQQDIETSTMFSEARSNPIEIDLTNDASAIRLYANGVWTTPS